MSGSLSTAGKRAPILSAERSYAAPPAPLQIFSPFDEPEEVFAVAAGLLTPDAVAGISPLPGSESRSPPADPDDEVPSGVLVAGVLLDGRPAAGALAGVTGVVGAALPMALSRAALVCGPTLPSGLIWWASWKVSTACRVAGPKKPSGVRWVFSMAFSSTCSCSAHPPW